MAKKKGANVPQGQKEQVKQAVKPDTEKSTRYTINSMTIRANSINEAIDKYKKMSKLEE